jgi:PAS domain S-box-containing protein
MATILIVDDQASDREFLNTVLGRAGHRVLHAADGTEALALANKQHPDLIISDILLPTMDGSEFVRQLRAGPGGATIPVIFNTAHYLENVAQRLASACGVTHVLIKSCEPHLILRTVAVVLGDKPPSSPPAENFNHDHVPPRSDPLSQKVNELSTVNARLHALVDLCLDLGSQRDPQRLLQYLCHAARDIAAARYAVVGVLEENGLQLRYIFTSGMDQAASTRLGSLDSRQGVLGTILQQRRCYRLHNSGGDQGSLVVSTAFPSARSFLGAPLASPARVYGWLCLIGKLGAEEFSSEDERLAGTLAAQVGRIYESSSLYADVVRHAAELEMEVCERRHAEDAVKEREERIRLLLDSTAEGIYGIDLQGQCTFANSACARLLGYAVPGQFLGKNMHKLIHHSRADGTPKPEEENPIYQAVRQGIGSHVEDEILWRADGSSFRAEYWSYPIRREGQIVGAVATFLDISERRSLEDQFRQVQKMEAVGRLAGGVCHDFNNLLTIINGYSDMLLAVLHKGDPMLEFAEQIRKAGERAVALTRQLLAFSRKQVLQPEVLDLKALMTDMGKMLRRLIGEDIDLKLASDTNLWRVKADPGQIEQVILNLCVNARDAMPQGGKLTLETRNVELDAHYATLHPDTPPGQYVLLAVSDTGFGMDPQTQVRIFEPFFTTKEAGKGTGLGLAIVHGIVNQSSGHVQVYSEPGVGTTFKIYLPREQQPVAGRKSHQSVARPRRGTETVLLVEDDDAVRALTRIILEKNGYRVMEARNGGEALLLCERHKDPIHLLVSDVVMPQMSGGQLAERLASLQPAMKVLLMSGYTDEAILRHGSLETDMPFLHKPFSPDALTQKVREVLDEPANSGAGRPTFG